MEPSGRNRWQPLANGKEGVDVSRRRTEMTPKNSCANSATSRGAVLGLRAPRTCVTAKRSCWTPLWSRSRRGCCRYRQRRTDTNGHIRNNTRDASRRIFEASLRPICRQNCAASDRACTRVTPRNLHGKEGSTVRVRQRALIKCLQIGTLLLSVR